MVFSEIEMELAVGKSCPAIVGTSRNFVNLVTLVAGDSTFDNVTELRQRKFTLKPEVTTLKVVLLLEVIT
jgi:hypothetical protein